MINFIQEFTKNILPIYEKHENTFDFYGIHSGRHISRSLIFSEFMSCFYKYELNKDVDFNAIRYAVAFHDSGRQRNGIDLWEKDSEKACLLYLYKKNHSLEYSEYVASLINKNKSSDINKNIIYDADVLEIMRPLTGRGGRNGFNPNYLLFMKDNEKYIKTRNELIEDAWKLIEYTENNTQLFNNNNYLYKLIEIIKENKIDLKLITKYQLLTHH